MTTTQLKVGSTVWVFDGNHRVYVDGKHGPVYREHFVPRVITGETSRSWMIGHYIKVPKKTLAGIYVDATAIDDACYVNDTKYQIARRVEQCQNATMLRAIERVLNTPEGFRP